ncbi:MAG: organic solvent tolerance protein OstA [Planctomycetota bacterium]|nr:organic solvent tolerance protein OstA [Planctomycetota bacterium]
MAVRKFAHAIVSMWGAALLLVIPHLIALAPSNVHGNFDTEIGVPLSDPKFAIDIFSHQATKQQQGVYDIYTFTGGCRVYQGSFSATCDKAHIWVDRTQTESSTEQQPKKVILQTIGNCVVRWSEEQRIEDQEWMGRLFSNLDLGFHVDVWEQTNGQVPDLNWSSGGSVRNAVAWSNNDSTRTQLANQNEILPRPGVQSTPRGGVEVPNGAMAPSMQIGNTQLGGTVIDAGAPKLFESIQPAPAKMEEVQSFQLPGQVDFGPAPVAGPVAFADPTAVRSSPRIGARTFDFGGRGGTNPELTTMNRPDRGDSVITLRGGIRLMFGGAAVQTGSGPMDQGTVLIEADNAVIWTADATRLNSKKIDDLPVEIYIEGNVVFQQGQRKIYAERMYYNVQAEYGMILGAEVLTPAPQYEGIVRLKADVIQQRSRENFMAYSAALTSSRLGVPRYWLQSDRIELSDRSNEPKQNLFGLPFVGRTPDQTGMQAKARNNFVYIEGFPVLYWPFMNSNVDTSNFYVSGLKYKNDRIFGNQVMVDFDLYQLLGLQGIDGTRWTASTDYLSERGFALGTNFNYNVPNLLLGPANGYLDAWGLKDTGLDFIGADRSGLKPEKDTRGRLLLKHKQRLSTDTELWAEVGLISDRNFMEQYFEQEWDTQKDNSTALRFRQYYDQQMIDIWGQARVNNFYTETQWLPRLDHYWLGQSIGDMFTYYTHSDIGYAKQQVASTPTTAQEAAKFQLQPWEVNASGLHAVTRHELNFPIDTGYYKFVPFLSGEAGQWGQDVTGNDITRLTGQAGLKSSLPMWRTFPEVQSSVLNLNGMAHKISFESEFLYADTTRDLNQFPLYNPIDDNSQEHFRRRLVFNTFGGVLPDQFDATKLAARQAMQRYVSAASSEVVTNQMQSRFGVHQRLQTKRGVAGRERIADVIEFDVDAIYFGNPDRDNFGQSLGGINYDFRYHIGDRVTLISDGYYDLFQSGLKATTIGSVLSRPGRGDVYFGLTSLKGPIDSLLLTTSFNYRLNEKWAAVGGTSVDLGKTGNIGQSLGVTRIGESFLIRVGSTVDSGRNNVAFNFSIEPRFFPKQGLGVVGGQSIPPAGLYGLE